MQIPGSNMAEELWYNPGDVPQVSLATAIPKFIVYEDDSLKVKIFTLLLYISQTTRDQCPFDTLETSYRCLIMAVTNVFPWFHLSQSSH